MALTVAVLVAGSLAACGASGGDEESTPTDAGTTAAAVDEPTADDAASAGMVGPVLVEIEGLEGSTVETTVGRMVVVNATDTRDWTAETADPAVAVHEQPENAPDSDVTYNVGFDAVAPGTTEVTLTAPDGTTTTFQITVEAAQD